MSELVLRTRLRLVEQNLARVASVMEEVERRRTELTELLDRLRDSDQSIESIRIKTNRQLIDADAALEKAQAAGDRDEVFELMADARESISQAKDNFRAIQAKLAEAGSRLDLLWDRQLYIKEGEGLGRTLENLLVGKADEIRGKVRAILANLSDADGDATDRQQAAWALYAEGIHECEPLFEEYVDFVRGLALRSTGFDKGICHIADRLLYWCDAVDKVSWESVTIPDRREASQMSAARIIRIGFPEWSLWDLPLTAHEFGHVAAGSHPSLVDYAKEQTVDAGMSRQIQDCLADAFATFSMGPAYACAAILLRLDPRAEEDDGGVARDAHRAHAVLSTLEWQNEEGGNPGTYGPVIERLTAAWTDATSQAGGSVPLTDEQRARLDSWQEFLREEVLKGDARGACYRARSWDKIKTWPDYLIEEEVGQIRPTKDLRDILNAAWVARLDRPDRVEDIGEAALQLINEVLQADATGPGNRPGQVQQKGKAGAW